MGVCPDSLIKTKIPECDSFLLWKRKNSQVDQKERGGKKVQFGTILALLQRLFWVEFWAAWATVARGVFSEPVPGVMAIAARWTAIAMWLVCILIGILVVLVGVLLLSAMLGARGHAVASLMCPLVVVVFIWCHQVATFIWGRVVSCVVTLSHSLALLITRTYQGHR